LPASNKARDDDDDDEFLCTSIECFSSFQHIHHFVNTHLGNDHRVFQC